ncbi:MAG: protocatechuate 3,4-dioxygenase [Ottowia sp.]|uniref:dioxygenase family protein n=1 Tax=Ottowia sp. TaxID=1898956 RepID=UPI003C719734
MKLERRGFFATMSGLALWLKPFSQAFAQTRTPRQTEGPYYPSQSMRGPDQDNDLVRVRGAVQEAGGEIIYLKGKVFAADKLPAEGARIEIWQVDTKGRYLHTGDSNSAVRDPHFQGFGYATADAEGTFRFRTIKPVPYPGRTPHIHAKVFHQGQELTTQFYIADHPQNDRDSIWRRLSAAEKEAVAMRFRKGPEGEETALTVYL